MKHIIAIIRNVKMNETKRALADVGLPSFTAIAVTGRGKGNGIGINYQKVLQDSASLEMLAQIGPEPRLKSKRLITLVVTDDKKDLAVNTIIKTNQTGNSGDGKIFVIEALGSYRVRTSETGDLTLD